MNNSDKINLSMTFAEFKQLLIQTTKDQEPLYSLLSRKLDSMVKHDLYTIYKTTTDPAEREQARKQYLDHIGVPDSFRW